MSMVLRGVNHGRSQAVRLRLIASAMRGAFVGMQCVDQDRAHREVEIMGEVCESMQFYSTGFSHEQGKYYTLRFGKGRIEFIYGRGQ